MPADACPLCASINTARFMFRKDVPVHQNLLWVDKQQAQKIVRGNLDMRVCANCGFVFNAVFDPALLSYGENYDNSQDYSPSFQRHLEGLVALLSRQKVIQGKQIIEVGCGRGQFLQRLIEVGANTGVGFDPSYSGPREKIAGRIRFESRYYDDSCADVAADVVICRHVIEHVPNPVALLKAIRKAIGKQTNARVFFETPCVEWILGNRVVWDFFYEHCSLFTATSLSTAFQLAGFRVEKISHVFGGQYLWIEASPIESDVSYSGGKIFRLAKTYGKHEQSLLEGWKKRIGDYHVLGGVALWGAGAKGVTFANLIDPECELIDCLVDLNPNKQGKFVAGSGHEIVAPGSLSRRGVRQAILMNPNYREENEAILANMGITIDLME